jgi:PKHD-type hydroxylase
MLITIPDVLGAAGLAACTQALAEASWQDGRRTAGYQAAQVKHNAQLAEDHPVARALGDTVLAALERTPRFISAALPLKVFPPMFNRYEGGQQFGLHVDTAIRQPAGTPYRVRSDLSATLFLADPASYDGGELIVEDTYGAHAVKLPAGHMVVYPASSLHRVAPVTRGVRVAAVFWIQSMVRDTGARTLLYDLDTSIQHLAVALPEHPAVVQLTGVYHNLLRRWADV